MFARLLRKIQSYTCSASSTVVVVVVVGAASVTAAAAAAAMTASVDARVGIHCNRIHVAEGPTYLYSILPSSVAPKPLLVYLLEHLITCTHNLHWHERPCDLSTDRYFEISLH